VGLVDDLGARVAAGHEVEGLAACVEGVLMFPVRSSMFHVPAALVLLSLVGCNQPPGVAVIAITPESPSTADDLEMVLIEPAEHDGDDPVFYEISWTLDGTAAGLDDDLVPADRTKKGERWRVTVRAVDDSGAGDSATAEVTIGNSPPVATVTVVADTASTSEDLVATAGGEDLDVDALTFSYSWTRDGVDAGITESTVPASATDRGQAWVVSVIANDGESDSDPVTARIDVDTSTLTDCGGGKLDEASGLCWQALATKRDTGWNDAVAYCDALVAGGSEAWSLPAIDQLQSLVRGCPEGDCPYMEGPAEGCYWDTALTEVCSTSWPQTIHWWSATRNPGLPDFTYVVDFETAKKVSVVRNDAIGSVRCVRVP
jgi:hypothetical protein